jgi:hypothetical protein
MQPLQRPLPDQDYQYPGSIQITDLFYESGRIFCGAHPHRRKKPGFTLQFLSANPERLRDFRFNPLRVPFSGRLAL